MLDFHDEASQREKCYTTVGQLPAFVDPKQPPSKKSPFSAILGHPFIHMVCSCSVLLSTTGYRIVRIDDPAVWLGLL